MNENQQEVNDAKENEHKTMKLIADVTNIVGKYTGYNGNEYGWCIYSNNRVCEKFLINKLLNPEKKNIEYKTKTAQEWKIKKITGKELLRNIEKFPKQNPLSPSLSPSPSPNTLGSPSPNALGTTLGSSNVSILSSVKPVAKRDFSCLFIQTPKYKRIEYQTCKEYDKYLYLMNKAD
jgi:hypothetical protein